MPEEFRIPLLLVGFPHSLQSSTSRRGKARHLKNLVVNWKLLEWNRHDKIRVNSNSFLVILLSCFCGRMEMEVISQRWIRLTCLLG